MPTRWQAARRPLLVWGLGCGWPPHLPVCGGGGGLLCPPPPPAWPFATALWLSPRWHGTTMLTPCTVSPRCQIAPIFAAPPSPSPPPPFSPSPAGTAPTLAGLRVPPPPPLLPLTPFRPPLPGSLRHYLLLLFLYYPRGLVGVVFTSSNSLELVVEPDLEEEEEGLAAAGGTPPPHPGRQQSPGKSWSVPRPRQTGQQPPVPYLGHRKGLRGIAPPAGPLP